MQKRILVVDDDTMNLVRTKMILEKEYSVLMADSGIEALERLKNGPRPEPGKEPGKRSVEKREKKPEKGGFFKGLFGGKK